MTEKFPVAFWNFTPSCKQSAADVKDWADCGMTVAMSPIFVPGRDDKQNMITMLDEAQKQGIKVILYDDRTTWRAPKTNGSFENVVRDAIADFGSHPAVLGFNVGDEPEKQDFADVTEMFRLQYKYAPGLTPFCNLLPCFVGTEERVGFTDWQKYLDYYVKSTGAKFLSYDCYTQMFEGTEGFDRYFNNLKQYHTAAERNGIPFWNTVLSSGHLLYRSTDEDALRWQLNTSVAHGARGVMYFLYYRQPENENYRNAPFDEHGNKTQTYHRLARVNKTFLKSTAAWFMELTLQRVTHFGKAYGGYELFTGTDIIRRVNSNNDVPLILSEFKDAEGCDYVAVVNNSQTESTIIEIRFNGIRPKALFAGWNESGYGKGEFREWNQLASGDDYTSNKVYLAPGQLTLIKITNNI